MDTLGIIIAFIFAIIAALIIYFIFDGPFKKFLGLLSEKWQPKREKALSKTESQYLKQLRQYILDSEPAWHPDLYIPISVKEGYRPDPVFWPQFFSKSSSFLGDRTSSQDINDILDELKKHQCPLVLTGGPGSGKSIILRQFGLVLISEAIEKKS